MAKSTKKKTDPPSEESKEPARPKIGSRERPITESHLKRVLERDPEADDPDKDFRIIQASVKDEFGIYSYEITSGPNSGDIIQNRKGAGRVYAEVTKALGRLNVHLAHIDDGFLYAGETIEDIDKMHTSDVAQRYHVSGVKLTGTAENRKISLIGSKYVTIGGRETVVTPASIFDNLCSYKWYNELNSEVDNFFREIELYKGGHSIPVEEPEEKPKKSKFKQLSLADQMNNDDANHEGGEMDQGEGDPDVTDTNVGDIDKPYERPFMDPPEDDHKSFHDLHKMKPATPGEDISKFAGGEV